jgi:hypothetical protein
MSDTPCRVTADLRRHEREEYYRHLDAEPRPEFDEHDDGIMHDVLGNDRLAKPVQALLLTLRDLKAINGSFGQSCINPDTLYKIITERLEALRKACEAEWQEMA